MRRFDLHALRFRDTGRRRRTSGGGAKGAPSISEVRHSLPVEVAPFLYGGLEYRVPGDVAEAELTAARVGDNLTLTLAVDTRVTGPCQRCLADADVFAEARGVEYVRNGDSETDDEDDAYVVAHQIDLERWVRDLIAGALPQKILCREDCRGLCAVCGADLNADPGHRHEEA